MWEQQEIEEMEELCDLACVTVEKQVIGHFISKKIQN